MRPMTMHALSEEHKLELSLAPPGEDWTIKPTHNFSTETDQKSHLSFGYFAKHNNFAQNHGLKQDSQSHLVNFQSIHCQEYGQFPVMKELSQSCSNKGAVELLHSAEKKGFSSDPANNTAVPKSSNNAQKRIAPAPVVGWPPIRSSRKNLANGSTSKLASQSPDAVTNKMSSQKPAENSSKTLFVKINMDGIPIGRKVDLKAYDSYEKLSYAVDELFRDLLAVPSDACVGEIKGNEERGKSMGGLLNGSGDYNLVYEDNEGDRMLVGDVPWHMFLLTVKRLRVLKRAELPTLSHGGKQGKFSLNVSLK